MKDNEKSVDLPPHGPRNPDPLTDAPGSHPIETGIGAAVGGAATGAAIGVALGPPGVILGTIAGAVAGGLAGKGVGELIDPTTEDNWIREWLAKRRSDEALDEQRAAEAYRFGLRARLRYPSETFDTVEPELRSEWQARRGTNDPHWEDARSSVREGFEKTYDLRDPH